MSNKININNSQVQEGLLKSIENLDETKVDSLIKQVDCIIDFQCQLKTDIAELEQKYSLLSDV
jgi:hypothetical protein